MPTRLERLIALVADRPGITQADALLAICGSTQHGSQLADDAVKAGRIHRRPRQDRPDWFTLHPGAGPSSDVKSKAPWPPRPLPVNLCRRCGGIGTIASHDGATSQCRQCAGTGSAFHLPR